MSQYDSIEQKASYGIGRNMGDQLAQQAFAGLDIPALQQGLADALNGLEFAVSRDDINDAFQVITARMQEEQEAVAKAVVAAALSESGYESTAAAKEAGVAYVLMGHGTAHVAKVTYSQMAAQMDKLGYENVFIGTVEGEPEDTSCEAVIAAVKEAGYTTVVLRPLMVVAGDHANNDMAGADEDSWKTMFEAAGFTVNCQISGLGRIADVQALYVAHAKAAIDAIA